jgi:hypothetical protein
MGYFGRPRRFPFVGQQVVEVVLRICADTLEYIAQVFKGIHGQAFACGCYARQDCSRPTTVVTAQECPVATFMKSFS